MEHRTRFKRYMGAVVNLMVSRKLTHMQKLLEIATMLVLKLMMKKVISISIPKMTSCV